MDHEAQAANAARSAGPAPANPERRQYPRHLCRVPATLHSVNGGPGVAIMLADVSETGCYVEASSVAARDTQVLVRFELFGIPLAERGVVTTSHPMVGMGIAFID